MGLQYDKWIKRRRHNTYFEVIDYQSFYMSGIS